MPLLYQTRLLRCIRERDLFPREPEKEVDGSFDLSINPYNSANRRLNRKMRTSGINPDHEKIVFSRLVNSGPQKMTQSITRVLNSKYVQREHFTLTFNFHFT